MGALFLSNPSALISNITFDNNTAEDGAAIIFEGSLANNCSLDIHDSVFSNGWASKTGGAIKWTGMRPNAYNCTFINNSAGFYGDDNASFPIAVRSTDTSMQQTDNHILNASFRSGQIFDAFNLALFDVDGNIVKNDNSSEMKASIFNISAYWDLDNTWLECYGNYFLPVNGVYAISKLQCIAQPISWNYINFSVPSINRALSIVTNPDFNLTFYCW